jgi:zinc protease
MMNIIRLLRKQGIVLLIGSLLTVQLNYAQDRLEQNIPVDEKIRIGKLENGLTYYIRKNSRPEKRVELRLVVKAGSVLEDEDQLGLAHFVEHMAFNGTKNFAKNDLVHYMQSVGVQFGPEVNAMTSFNETIYMLTLPTDSVHILEKGFQIMEDWAHNLTFDDAEIDKERGIIVEEWRINQGLNQRLMDKLYPALFEGSQYAARLPIGKKEVIEGAPHSTLKKFYTDWYRPDLMAFIVVGDIDPDAIEKDILNHFNNLQNPRNARERKSYPVPDQPGTKALVVSDKEMPVVQLALFCKTDPEKQTVQNDYRRLLANQLVTGMLTQRLNELKEQADPPILNAQVAKGSIVPEKGFFQMIALVPETGVERGVKTLITESERAVKYGFTPGELARQKKDYFAMIESAYNEREKTNSANLAAEYMRNFLSNEPIPGIEFEYNFAREYLEGITLEEVNELVRKNVTPDNRIMVVLAPQKEGLPLPGEDQVLADIQQVSVNEITPYLDKLAGSQLMADKPKKGRILLTKKNEDLGILEMKLSNGAKVVLKPTEFKNDEVLFSAFSPGGYSIYDINDFQSAFYADDIVNECGVAGYSPSDLDKLLAGKNISAGPYIGEYYEGIGGTSVPRDLESMLQMVYLYFTQPRKDSVLFESMMSLQKDYFRNANSNPEAYFDDQFTRAKTQNNPRAGTFPTDAEIDQVKLNRLYEIYLDRFGDASDFTFFFVGSFKTDSLKPLIETYLASLPSLKRIEAGMDMGIRPPAKKTDHPVYKGSDPKSRVGLYFETPEPYDPLEDHIFESLGQLLSIRYLDVLREEMSGVYSVGANCDLIRTPYSHTALNIIIPCSPDNVDKLTEAAFNEIRLIQKKGVAPEDLVKVKEAQRRDFERNLKENGYWIGLLTEIYKYNDPSLFTQYSNRIEAVTSEKLQEAAQKIDLKKYVRVVLLPEK